MPRLDSTSLTRLWHDGGWIFGSASQSLSRHTLSWYHFFLFGCHTGLANGNLDAIQYRCPLRHGGLASPVPCLESKKKTTSFSPLEVSPLCPRALRSFDDLRTLDYTFSSSSFHNLDRSSFFPTGPSDNIPPKATTGGPSPIYLHLT
ncbi:hypothetical protein S40285_10465 [Stachybotrys chlorohalonatus IBT 40285]|uniref:Uncharacterized protein n=1 Tax=Stachybotrys chlorohalonatus (strain IBT 40285) TaxID=1283841 RepID=A0A084QTT1_STAC4|nr:hypothetical protein S40285_10465 [Stachybotrys chlorohalonata IBT 40285]